MFELGLFMALLGFLWFSVSFVLGMWKNGVLFEVPEIYAFIKLGVWVGGGPILGIGFWLAVIATVVQLVRIL